MSDSLQPHGLQPTKLLRPWDFPGKSTGVGCLCLLQPQAWDVLISSFLPSTGGQHSEQRHFNSQAEGQDSLRLAVMYDYHNKSNRKQVKETVLTRVKIGFSLQQDLVFEALDTVLLTFPGPALVSRTMDICGYPFL